MVIGTLVVPSEVEADVSLVGDVVGPELVSVLEGIVTGELDGVVEAGVDVGVVSVELSDVLDSEVGDVVGPDEVEVAVKV